MSTAIIVKSMFGLLCAISFGVPGNAQKECTNCGLIISKLAFFDTISNKYVSAQAYWPDRKAWYKDSLVILEAPGLIIKSDTNSLRETRQVIIDHYTFIDLRTRSFYEYATFSDTAVLVEKYTQPDTVSGRVGWTFYAPRDIPFTEPPLNLTDTVIGGILYQRVQFINRKEGVLNPVLIAYLQCDKKGTFFQIDRNFSEKRGCPIVKYEELPTPQNPVASAGEIVFVADSLSPAELKVFAAWERNAIKSPVR